MKCGGKTIEDPDYYDDDDGNKSPVSGEDDATEGFEDLLEDDE